MDSVFSGSFLLGVAVVAVLVGTLMYVLSCRNKDDGGTKMAAKVIGIICWALALSIFVGLLVQNEPVGARTFTIEEREHSCIYQWANLRLTNTRRNSFWLINTRQKKMENVVISTSDFQIKVSLSPLGKFSFKVPYIKGRIPPVTIVYLGKKAVKDFSKCPVQ